LTAAFCPKRLRDFYSTTPPHPLKNYNRLLYCILKKIAPKSRPEKGSKKVAKKAAKNLARKVDIKFIPEPVLLLS